MSLPILAVVAIAAVVVLLRVRPVKRSGHERVSISLLVKAKTYFFSQAER